MQRGSLGDLGEMNRLPENVNGRNRPFKERPDPRAFVPTLQIVPKRLILSRNGLLC